MKRFAASIEYYGTNYSGWQKQKQTLDTVQGFLIDSRKSRFKI